MTVSVIIPCYNVADFIEECVDSVLSQSYPVSEIILVDNNSTDYTQKVLRKLQSESKLIPLKVSFEEKKGACAARNKGTQIAFGNWIQYLDADDLLMKDKIKSQIQIINSDVDLIVEGCINLSLDGTKKNIEPKNDIYKGLMSSRLGNTCSNLWRKEAVVNAGCWNEALSSSQEADLMFRMIKANGKIVFSNAKNTIIRERESGQITKSNPIEKWKNYIQLRFRLLDFLKKNRPEYFENNREYFLMEIFNKVRLYAKFDIEKASLFFQKLEEEEIYFFLQKNSFKYSLMLRLLGFKNTERLFGIK